MQFFFSFLSFGDLKSQVFWSIQIIFMKALELLGCCSRRHTLFYFGNYRALKSCGYIAVRLYSKGFRNLDQVVFLLEPQSWMGKAGWFCFPSLQPRAFSCCEKVCLLSECVLSQAAVPCSHRGIFYTQACRRHVKMKNCVPSGVVKKSCL